MAILGPSDLPYILQVDSDPIKKYVLSKLGWPTVEVEVHEDQWETILKTSGNFIAHYFSKEQMFAVFYTDPLENTYDLPTGAYWIQEVAWDPVTTMIDQIFGAESFLFCFGPGTKIMRSDCKMVLIEDWQEDYKAKTPFGNKSIKIEKHDEDQHLLEIEHEHGKIIVTPNHPLKTGGLDDMMDGWMPAIEYIVGSELVLDGSISKVTGIKELSGPTNSIIVPAAHCFWASVDGQPVLVS
ncbi:MAG: hypothetical protein QF535_11980 [Anaerolineales bacterium]|nr:hypothetical protein [Anaerolineales bacterium]